MTNQQVGALPPAASAARYFSAGLDQMSRGEWREAFENLEKCVELDPEHAGACKELARLSLRANEVRAFVNWCHEASRIDPDDPEPYVMMGELLESQGRGGEAIEALSRSLELRPLPVSERLRVEGLIAGLRARKSGPAYSRRLE